MNESLALKGPGALQAPGPFASCSQPFKQNCRKPTIVSIVFAAGVKRRCDQAQLTGSSSIIFHPIDTPFTIPRDSMVCQRRHTASASSAAGSFCKLPRSDNPPNSYLPNSGSCVQAQPASRRGLHRRFDTTGGPPETVLAGSPASSRRECRNRYRRTAPAGSR